MRSSSCSDSSSSPRASLAPAAPHSASRDRKSTRLNSSHGYISYAVFCLKKKKKISIRHSPDLTLSQLIVARSSSPPRLLGNSHPYLRAFTLLSVAPPAYPKPPPIVHVTQ